MTHRALLALALSAVAASACSGATEPADTNDTGIDTESDSTESDAVELDTTATDTDESDTGGDVDAVSCLENSDCASGLCVQANGEGVCSQLCDSNSDCPDTWICFATSAAVGTVNLCIPPNTCLDADGDGFGVGDLCAGADCDDNDATANPLGREICDGVDNNCNELIDDAAIDANVVCDTAAGACSGGRTVCTAGTLTCEATAIAASEVCDDVDNDCDGVVDEDAIDGVHWYPDTDGDGFGDPTGSTMYACEQPDGYAGNPLDCDDSNQNFNPAALEDDCSDFRDFNCDGFAGNVDSDNDGLAACEECNDGDADVYPGATEICDGRDNDCDGILDEGVTLGACDTGDLGTCAIGTLQCIGGDERCVRDLGPTTELCDSEDNDCDGDTDEDVVDGQIFFADDDGDGFGDPSSTVMDCAPPSGYVADAGDCDDSTSATAPGEPELCDNIDNNCNNETDEGNPEGDVVCDTGELGECAAGTTICANTGSVVCERNTNSSAEICNGLDDDCDGSIDEQATGEQNYYADNDSDGYGDPDSVVRACSPPANHVTNGNDCDDGTSAAAPGLTEVCDGIDNDCDGTPDDSIGAENCVTGQAGVCAAGRTQCSGGALSCVAISAPSTDVCDGLDNNCDGSTDNDIVSVSCSTGQSGVCGPGTTSCNGGATTCNPTVAPTSETCDGLDNNCDGSVDNGVASAACNTGNSGVCSAGTTSCSGGSTSCNQTNSSSTEVCDGIDNNCDGLVDNGVASVACTTGSPGVCSAGTTSCSGGSTSCNATTGSSVETCDGLDNNCDGSVDNGVASVACNTGNAGVCAAGTTSCSGGSTSCNQTSGATLDVCDGVDNDCDGSTDEEFAGGTCETGQPGVCATGFSFCADGTVGCNSPRPGIEVCDGLDNDCDGSTDERLLMQTYYPDSDLDGFGDSSLGIFACESPGRNWVTQGGDCYDSNNLANPDAFGFQTVDRGDGSFDYNCDGLSSPSPFTNSASTRCTAACDPSGYWSGFNVPACGETGNRLLCSLFSPEFADAERAPEGAPPPPECFASSEAIERTQSCR